MEVTPKLCFSNPKGIYFSAQLRKETTSSVGLCVCSYHNDGDNNKNYKDQRIHIEKSVMIFTA